MKLSKKNVKLVELKFFSYRFSIVVSRAANRFYTDDVTHMNQSNLSLGDKTMGSLFLEIGLN